MGYSPAPLQSKHIPQNNAKSRLGGLSGSRVRGGDCKGWSRGGPSPLLVLFDGAKDQTLVLIPSIKTTRQGGEEIGEGDKVGEQSI